MWRREKAAKVKEKEDNENTALGRSETEVEKTESALREKVFPA